MPEHDVARRTVLRTAGGAAAVVGGLALADPGIANEHGWEVAEVPTGQPLYDVAQTANGPYAVGGEGVVLERTDDATWEVALEDGPAGQQRTLYAAAATDGGGRLWFAGDGGALGDVDDGSVTDHSEPAEIDDTLRAVVVDGGRDGERALAVSGGHAGAESNLRIALQDDTALPDDDVDRIDDQPDQVVGVGGAVELRVARRLDGRPRVVRERVSQAAGVGRRP